MGRLKNYFDKVKLVKEKIPNSSFLSAIMTPFDLHFWRKHYRLLESEYFFYHFHQKNKQERLEYVRDVECMYSIPNTFNNSPQANILDDKSAFNVYFHDCIGRDFLLINTASTYEQFVSFVNKHPVFMCKPLNNLGGFGITRLDCSTADIDQLWKHIKNQGEVLLEEVLIQHPDMAALNPDTLNTLRVLSMVNDKGEISIPLANVRIGRAGACVDNFCSGGMSAGIDIKTGVVFSPAYTKQLEEYVTHPDTQCPILGHQIPEWENVLATVKRSAERLPELRYIGWDVAIKNDGTICLIEGNHNAGSDVHQVAAGVGLRSVYEEHLGHWD